MDSQQYAPLMEILYEINENLKLLTHPLMVSDGNQEDTRGREPGGIYHTKTVPSVSKIISICLRDAHSLGHTLSKVDKGDTISLARKGETALCFEIRPNIES